MAEGGGPHIEGDGNGVGLGFVINFSEHGEKAVDAVGEVAGLGGEELDAEEGAVEEAVAVED